MSKMYAIERTVDVYPNLTPVERYRLLIEERQTYSKEFIETVFKNLDFPKKDEDALDR